MEVEERAKGVVDKSVFTYYIAQIGKLLVVMVIMLYVMDNFVRVFRDWWMSRWAMHDVSLIVGYDSGWTENEITTYFLTMYSISGFTIIGFTAARTIIIQVVGLGAARKLHEKMLWRLLKSPVSFFDQTPVGRIVNRFTSDFQTIDRGNPHLNKTCTALHVHWHVFPNTIGVPVCR
jgi:ABC-type multidrug transport system fused ATPase/permease subunit